MYDTSQKRLGRTVGGEALLAEIPNERQAAREQRLGFFFQFKYPRHFGEPHKQGILSCSNGK